MKNLIFLFLILVIMSCQNTSDKEIEVKRDTSELNGIWGLTNYFDTIVANKEIAKYRVQHPTWFAFLLEIRDDSIFHYGSILNTANLYDNYKIEWNKDTLIKMSSYVNFEDKFHLIKKDTFLILKQYESYNSELDTTTYIFRRRDDLAYLLDDNYKNKAHYTIRAKAYHKTKGKVTDYFNSRILVGEYRNIKTNRKVVFDENGIVKGITGFDSFEINSYFGTSHSFCNLDVVLFKGKKAGFYNWVFNKNKLILTEFILEEGNEDYYTLGKRKIELERVK